MSRPAHPWTMKIGGCDGRNPRTRTNTDLHGRGNTRGVNSRYSLIVKMAPPRAGAEPGPGGLVAVTQR